MASRPGVGRAVPRSPGHLPRAGTEPPHRGCPAAARRPGAVPPLPPLPQAGVTFGNLDRGAERLRWSCAGAVRESRGRRLESCDGSAVRAEGPRLRPRSEGEQSLGFAFIAPHNLTLVEFSFLRLTLQSTVCQQVKGKCTNPCKAESFFLEISNSTPAVIMLSLLLQQWFLNRSPGNDFLHRETSSRSVIFLWCTDRDCHK